MLRLALIFTVLVGSMAGQLPADLRARLNDKDAAVREEAVKELGAMAPSPTVSASTLASALATAVADPEQSIRIVAARSMRGDRPAEIVVPALLKALAAVEAEAEAARQRLIEKAAAGTRPSRTEVGNYVEVGRYADALLDSLRDHWGERAASGLAEIVNGWKLDRVPGTTVESACVILCRLGTSPALNAVVGVLSRAPTPPPARVLPEKGKPIPHLGLVWPLGTYEIKRILMELDTSVSALGVEKPPGFDPTAPAEWKALLAANTAKIPSRLPESRPAASKRAQAKIETETIKAAVLAYRLQSGDGKLRETSDFPRVLIEPGVHGEEPVLDPDSVKGGRLLDPWGHEYVYCKLSGSTFEILSYGEDGAPGGAGNAADISSKPK